MSQHLQTAISVFDSWNSHLGMQNNQSESRRVIASGNLGTWKSGNLEIWGPRNLGTWTSGDLEIQNVGVQNMEQIKILKIQIRSAQNVGKVWISRNKNPPGPIWGHLRQFFPWTEKH